MSILDLLRYSRASSKIVSPEVQAAFYALLKEERDLIWSCDEEGNLVTYRLALGGQSGITRSVKYGISDEPREQGLCIFYLIQSDGVIEKMLCREDADGRPIWSRLQFEAHEADELLNALTVRSLRYINA